MDSTKPLAKVNDHVYDDIDPKMEWVKDAGDTLLVHLPDSDKAETSDVIDVDDIAKSTVQGDIIDKENTDPQEEPCTPQLNIEAATADQKLKITGKSQQGDSKWIRFNKNLTVSSDYDLNQVRAKFEGGVLYIKHPKKISSPTKLTHLESLKSLQMKNQKDQNSGQDSAAKEAPPKTDRRTRKGKY
ncbi:hypothetical protein SADUNF_Sadunf09G0124300 [Salix dunnii]|uniref:SHSP domain-containing protein n=1 Tax=Salix dunnii TaxID=1413687 RepID=A0A835N0G3_9ROSI|nr:hypothetical protein SADUNF_Sadunf09G0124300 [Salix dunnii]